MKTKTTLIILAITTSVLQAQLPDSLWTVFKKELNEIVLQEKGNTTYNFDNSFSRNGKLTNILMNSPIEEQGLEYMFQNFGRDSLPNVRDFLRGVFHNIARNSNNKSARKAAIKYSFALPEATIGSGYALFFEPRIYGLRFGDFDDDLKQELMKLYTRQFSDEELSFYAESHIKYRMKASMNSYEIMITDSVKKYQGVISYEDAKEKIFQSEVSVYKQRLQNATPSYRILINTAQLNMTEAIPYLEKYANEGREYAVYALAYMGVGDYLTRSIQYFSTDDDRDDRRIASVMNNQDIWYAYIHRIKSEKYVNNCPVAYRTISDLGYLLKDFPITDRPWFEDTAELPNGMIILIPSKIEPVRIVPDDCGMSTQAIKTPINPDHIKVVVDWMEANKGNYELQRNIDRTF